MESCITQIVSVVNVKIAFLEDVFQHFIEVVSACCQHKVICHSLFSSLDACDAAAFGDSLSVVFSSSIIVVAI